jgi:hypothetical protein
MSGAVTPYGCRQPQDLGHDVLQIFRVRKGHLVLTVATSLPVDGVSPGSGAS